MRRGSERPKRRLSARVLVAARTRLRKRVRRRVARSPSPRAASAIVPGVREFVEQRAGGRLASRGADARGLGGARRRTRQSMRPSAAARELGVRGGSHARRPRRAGGAVLVAELPARCASTATAQPFSRRGLSAALRRGARRRRRASRADADDAASGVTHPTWSRRRGTRFGRARSSWRSTLPRRAGVRSPGA